MSICDCDAIGVCILYTCKAVGSLLDESLGIRTARRAQPFLIDLLCSLH